MDMFQKTQGRFQASVGRAADAIARLPMLVVSLTIVVFGYGLQTQNGVSAQKRPSFQMPMDSGFGDFPSFGEPMTLSASYTIQEGSNRGRLSVDVELEGNHYIYSITQGTGGPIPTTIDVVSSNAKLLGQFTPDHAPTIELEEAFGIDVEKFKKHVTWSAPISLETVSDPPGEIKVLIAGQICDAACLPFEKEIVASFASFTAPPPAPGTLRIDDTHATWSVQLSENLANPGDRLELTIKGKVHDDYHLYPIRVGEVDDEGLPVTDERTLLSFDQKSGLTLGEPAASSEAEPHEFLPGEPPIYYHSGDVTWTIPVTIPQSAVPGIYMLDGQIGFQTCSEESCDMPQAIRFTGELAVGDEYANDVGSKQFALAASEFNSVAESTNLLTWVDKPKTYTAMPPLELMQYLCLAVMGGFVLNFMPCVLPVIGLKVMSFVQEGGENSRRTTWLNLWYVAGLLSVLLTLAIATIAFRHANEVLTWGEQYGDAKFRTIMLVVVTAMALSFLGVWEIPIPGFATSKKSNELMGKEGALGAFLKGVMTTILATPCSGPGLGAVFALTITQPDWVIVALFLAVGLGLSLPYLVIAFYPSAISFLPKPGPWMETLKQVLAFPLLLTSVYFIQMYENDSRIAAMILFVMVWFGCWLIGRVPAYAESERKLAAWAGAVAIVVVGGWIGFNYFGPVKKPFDWVPYSESKLADLRQDGKTVMLDFTAKWCPNCKTNLAAVIERKNIANVLDEYGIVPMLADYSQRNSPQGLEIKRKLAELQSPSIPLLAVYPPNGDPPILLRDLLTTTKLVDALKQAGPSRGIEATDGDPSLEQPDQKMVSAPTP